MKLTLTAEQVDVLRFYLTDCIVEAEAYGESAYLHTLEDVYKKLGNYKKQIIKYEVSKIPW